ncbi:MAG: hypothetical protein A2776_00215 [Candidatus Levybacteria bacterium RIFCSPHIGHO2_01_FULL_40_10]|nr:MAG: hypothetical protein A2776_00215 [Candidatus Levybacteria bacterium RIFCSPHIGHO2_01_FULL_40_10]
MIPALADAGVTKIVIVNRTPENAEYVAGIIRRDHPDLGIETGTIKDIPRFVKNQKFDLVLNTTDVGQEGLEGRGGLSPLGSTELPREENLAVSGSIIEALKAENPDIIFADIVYTPLITPFLRQAQSRGLRISQGDMMLIHQAALAFQFIVGTNNAYEEIVGVMKKAF